MHFARKSPKYRKCEKGLSLRGPGVVYISIYWILRLLKGAIMNRKWLWLAVVGVLAGSMLVTVLGQAGQAEPRAQWEYRAVVISGPFSTPSGRAKIEGRINELGSEGWELVDFEESMYVLKRPR